MGSDGITMGYKMDYKGLYIYVCIRYIYIYIHTYIYIYIWDIILWFMVDMGVSMSGVPHSWMVYFMEHPSKMDENRGYPHDLGNLNVGSIYGNLEKNLQQLEPWKKSGRTITHNILFWVSR